MTTPRRGLPRFAVLLLIAIATICFSAPPARAALGDVLRDNDPGGPQGNGRGLAFDGLDLYYTLVGDSNIYKMTAGGNPPTALATIPIPPGDPRVAAGGPLAWDGTYLWTTDQSSALILYQVNAVTGDTVFSCDIAAANPGHPALPGLVNPDGMDYDGSHIILSGGRTQPGAPEPNAVAFLNPDCTIASWFPTPVGQGAAGWGTSGVAFENGNLWHATALGPGGNGTVFFQTDTAGTTTGSSFSATRTTMDLAYDPNTFSPLCAVWGHEGNGSAGGFGIDVPPIILKEHITAYEIPCGAENHPPLCDAGGPYQAECNGGTGTVLLDGTGSSDPDGDTLTYAWSSDCIGESIVDPSGSTTDLTASGPPPCPVSCTATLKVTDTHGADATCTASIGIVDTTPPNLTPPAPISLECTSPAGVGKGDASIVEWLAQCMADDSCSSVMKGNDAPSDFPLGCDTGHVTTVTFTATDDCGNPATGTSTVTVTDTTPPDVTPPAPLTLECKGPSGLPLSDPDVQAWLAGASGTDLCGSTGLGNNAPSDFPSGCRPGVGTTVTFTGTDDCGNHSSQDSTLTVQDTTPPMVTPPDPLALECEGPGGVSAQNAQIQAWLASATGSDLCSNATVGNNAPTDFPFACQGLATNVTFTATDGCGLSSSADSTVTVSDTTGPTISVPVRLKIYCSGQDPVPVTDPQIQAWLALAQGTDLCSNVSVTNDAAGDFPTFCKNTPGIDVVFTATDDCGNKTFGISAIKVVDEAEPVLVAPPPLVTGCANALAPTADPTIQAWLDSATASDLCTAVTITFSYPPEFGHQCTPGTTVPVTFIATDTCGNIETQMSSVTFTPKTKKGKKLKHS